MSLLNPNIEALVRAQRIRDEPLFDLKAFQSLVISYHKWLRNQKIEDSTYENIKKIYSEIDGNKRGIILMEKIEYLIDVFYETDDIDYVIRTTFNIISNVSSDPLISPCISEYIFKRANRLMNSINKHHNMEFVPFVKN